LEKIEVPKSPCSMPAIQTDELLEDRPVEAELAAHGGDLSRPVASSPAMIAAGSPGASRSRKNTKIATTAMTGMVASSREDVGGHVGVMGSDPMALGCSREGRAVGV
jgi:hypothetical protein